MWVEYGMGKHESSHSANHVQGSLSSTFGGAELGAASASNWRAASAAIAVKICPSEWLDHVTASHKASVAIHDGVDSRAM